MESAILNVRTFQNKRSIFRPKTSVALSACAFPVLIIALFAWLISHGGKYCWLICYEKKILFVG